MATKTTKKDTSHSDNYDQASAKRSFNLYPSGMVEQILVQLAKKFPHPLEILVYLIGDCEEKINKVVVPEHIIGVKVTGNDNSERLENYFDPFGETKTMPGVRKDTEELGLQIVSYREGMTRDNCLFLPLSELVLDRPLARYLPKSSLRSLFPQKAISKISNKELRDLVLKSQNLKKYSHVYFDEKCLEVEFLPDLPLYVDSFSSKGSLIPMSGYIFTSLFPTNNKFMKGTSHGMSHIHYSFTDEQKEKDLLVRECSKFDEHFVELISPGDAVGIITRSTFLKSLSNGAIDSSVIFEGVTTIDPITMDLVGSTYFDVSAINENNEDMEEFHKLALASGFVTDFAWLRDFFHLVRKYSSPQLPKYVDSSTT